MRPRIHDSKWTFRAIGLTASALVGLIAALLSVSTISLSPPSFKLRQLSVAGAETHVMVDAPPPSEPGTPPYSTILDFGAQSADFDTLSKRAELFTDLVTTEPVVDRIAARMRISPSRLYVYQSPLSYVPVALAEPSNEKRAFQLIGLRRPYVLELQVRTDAPIIDFYAQAPTPAAAAALAQAAVLGLRDYVGSLRASQALPPGAQVRLLQVGTVQGVVLSSGRRTIAVLTFLSFFLLSWGGLLLTRAWRQNKRRRGLPDPRRAVARANWRTGWRNAALEGGDWPRTTRLLPWLIAAFIAMVYLVPFDQIQLNASLPISFPLDRLVLPFIIGLWILALVVGGPGRPRLRLTWIHAAVGVFMICALLSVVLNAPELNHDLELTAGIKRLPYLLSFLSVFVIIASVVRRTEVGAFLKYILVLAVLCAIGMLVEYRTAYNVFYDLPHKLLGSVFEVGTAQQGVDALGRRQVEGPASQPLEAVTMLALALPIALMGLTRAKQWRPRIGYLLATCLLLAATVATYRKSALLVPLAIIATLVFFRPRQMLRLAPLAVVVLVGVHLAAPGAFGSITAQLQSNNLNVPTVNDRVVRYDAVYPDVWSHLLLGRGYGTYDHVAHRILDSEILGRLIEMGVIGLAAYLMMMVSVVLVGRRSIRSRDPARASPALIGAAGALALIVSSALYDTWSFPHGPYIFLCLAGFVAVVSDRSPTPAEIPARRSRTHRGTTRPPDPAKTPYASALYMDELPSPQPVGAANASNHP